MLNQQEQLKQEMEMQMAEYQKLVKDSQSFRGQYAYKLQEIIEAMEKTMRYNVEQLNFNLNQYATNSLNHTQDQAKSIEQLQVDIKNLQLKD